MPITEQGLEAAKELLRAEFKSHLDAALQELSVQIKESHNQVVESATASFTQAVESAAAVSSSHDENLKEEVASLSREIAAQVSTTISGEYAKNLREVLESQVETIRQGIVQPPVIPAPTDHDEGVSLRLEQHHLYLDDLADRLGQPRMEVL